MLGLCELGGWHTDNNNNLITITRIVTRMHGLNACMQPSKRKIGESGMGQDNPCFVSLTGKREQYTLWTMSLELLSQEKQRQYKQRNYMQELLKQRERDTGNSPSVVLELAAETDASNASKKKSPSTMWRPSPLKPLNFSGGGTCTSCTTTWFQSTMISLCLTCTARWDT